MRRSVLVTGINGQDGTYLAELALEQGYTVHGTALQNDRSPFLPDEVELHVVDQRDHDAVLALVREVRPGVIVNLAAISSVGASWDRPFETSQVNAMGALSLLESALALQEDGHEVRVVQASSSEIFGQPDRAPQDERTPLRPLNPYGAAKAYAHHLVQVYRGHGLHASNGILFNHESPRRPTTFVTRKITSTVAAIARGRADRLVLGNLEARRDWGWAPDHVRALLLAAEAEEGDDYVIATGRTHSVRDFVAAAFRTVGIHDWEHLVSTDPQFFRPADATESVGDPGHARSRLGWRPTTTFEEMVTAMVHADLEELA